MKTKSDSSKKSPNKEKKEEKAKEAEKPKPKERPVEPKAAKKDAPIVKGKKGKAAESDKPADFDDGLWQEVPKKSDKKKVKSPEEKNLDTKKESPAKKGKKSKVVEKDVEAGDPEPSEEVIKVVSAVGPDVDENAAKALQEQVAELQRILNEVCISSLFIQKRFSRSTPYLFHSSMYLYSTKVLKEILLRYLSIDWTRK